MMLHRLLAALEAWFYGSFDRISALLTDDVPDPERDALASPAPAFARVPPALQGGVSERTLAG